MADIDPLVTVEDQTGKFVMLVAIDPTDKKPYPLIMTKNAGLKVVADLTVSDIQIGAVEIKDASTADRAGVDHDLLSLNVNPKAPTSFVADTKALSGSAEKLVASSTPVKRGVILRNDKNNSNDMWIGPDSGVAVDNGYPIHPGESHAIDIDDLEKVWVIGTGTEKLHYQGW